MCIRDIDSPHEKFLLFYSISAVNSTSTQIPSGSELTDIAAGRQLKVIGEVLAGCESIIVATDAGREGELIFRWIYSYLGCTKPFKRLWISSLTDEAIREGMASLKRCV